MDTLLSTCAWITPFIAYYSYTYRYSILHSACVVYMRVKNTCCKKSKPRRWDIDLRGNCNAPSCDLSLFPHIKHIQYIYEKPIGSVSSQHKIEERIYKTLQTSKIVYPVKTDCTDIDTLTIPLYDLLMDHLKLTSSCVPQKIVVTFNTQLLEMLQQHVPIVHENGCVILYNKRLHTVTLER